MSACVYAPAAQQDIDQIYDYTAERWGTAQAEHYVRQLRDTCNDIASGKLRGRDVSRIRSGYRKQSSGSHLIFYRETPLGIEVVRILHQRMDALKNL